MKLKEVFIELAETLVTTLVVIYILYTYIAVPELVWGASMSPTFETGERILVEKVTKHFKPLERGEIVVLNPPSNPDVDYVKRVVGIPGDIVKILNCNVHISRGGEQYLLDEYYISEEICTQSGKELREGRSIRLKDNEYIVLGDNRSNSADSRFFGAVEANSIVGRVIFRFYPFSNIGFVNR